MMYYQGKYNICFNLRKSKIMQQIKFEKYNYIQAKMIYLQLFEIKILLFEVVEIIKIN